MNIKPIHGERDYREALGEVQRLWEAPVGSKKADRLEVLTILVEKYEKEHYPIDPPHPIHAVLFRMEQEGLERRDLEPLIGSRGRVAEVLTKQRPLSISMIRRLHHKLGIPADVLIAPYKLKAGSR
jgi:HTH-type transcriptional regulator / antitoxin HigA